MPVNRLTGTPRTDPDVRNYLIRLLLRVSGAKIFALEMDVLTAAWELAFPLSCHSYLAPFLSFFFATKAQRH
jgi:hypothetical protein